MQKIAITSLKLAKSVGGTNIRSLRDKIVAIVGNENHIWHGHTDGGGCNYDYPLIQYRPKSIIGIGSGSEVLLSEWMKHRDDFGEVQMNVTNFALDLIDGFNVYYIHRWMPFNSENHEIWKNSIPTNQHYELERLIKAHILTFARAVNWHVETEIKVQVTEVVNVKKVNIMNTKTDHWEDTNFVSFGIIFKTNAALPYGIGLGRSVRLGYGALEPEFHAQQYLKNPSSELIYK